MTGAVHGAQVTVRGLVQGVGFRPAVWRLAQEMGLSGDVKNTAEGVVIRLWGEGLDRFPARRRSSLPALARIEELRVEPLHAPPPPGFDIVASEGGEMRGSVTPDAATCAACLAEIGNPFERRFRYPFANCTNCGPRFSIVTAAPYDRARTTMAPFDLCDACAAEYRDPADRRFHAQPIACGRCGPRIWIEKLGPGAVQHEAFSMLDDIDATGGMILRGHIVAIRGLGGVHLACDATNARAVEELRRRKRRPAKALALMARDLEVVRAFCEVSEAEAAALTGPEAPIVLLKARPNSLPAAIAPGLDRLGVILPYTPFHHMILRRIGRPVVMTSGNPSGEPQCVTNAETRERLAGIADFACLHDREIANRIDDSVVRVDLGRPRLIRRARGYAPAPLPLPPGFSRTDQVLAMGSELKNTFCLVKEGQAILSQHMGDLEDAATHADAARNLDLYTRLFDHAPALIAVDSHPQYLSTQAGHARAEGRPVIAVQHHHAHVAACLAENGRPLDAPPVLGIAMDGTGLGDDGTIWGGEFLVCDYRGYTRAGSLKPVALPGGAAVREPWRNAYAHLMAQMGWAEFAMNFSGLPIFARLSEAPQRHAGCNDRQGAERAPLHLLRAAHRCGRRHRRPCLGPAGLRRRGRDALRGGHRPHRDGGTRRPRLSLHDPAPRRQGTPLYRAAGGLARDAGRPDPRNAGGRDRRPISPRPCPGDRPHGRADHQGYRHRHRRPVGRVLPERDPLCPCASGARGGRKDGSQPREGPANDGGLALGQAVVALANSQTEQTDVPRHPRTDR